MHAEDWAALVAYVIFAVIAMVFVAFQIGQASPSADDKTKVICEYQGGQFHQDICIKNNMVLEIRMK